VAAGTERRADTRLDLLPMFRITATLIRAARLALDWQLTGRETQVVYARMAAALGVRSYAGRTPEGTSSRTCRKRSGGHFRKVPRIVQGYTPGLTPEVGCGRTERCALSVSLPGVTRTRRRPRLAGHAPALFELAVSVSREEHLAAYRPKCARGSRPGGSKSGGGPSPAPATANS
jgi:hypothetical protein